MSRPTYLAVSCAVLIMFFACDLSAQNQNDNRQEYVRSSSPTSSGGRVFNESIGGQRMVRIARGPGKSTEAAKNVGNQPDANRRDRQAAQGKYNYPEPGETEQVTAYRQAANQPPQLRFPPNNRLAQANCNCNGVPVPAQQLQFQQPPVGFNYAGYQAPQAGVGFQAPTGFQPQPGFGAPPQAGYPIQAGIGVPQFNPTGGNWWTPFVTGSGYYTPLLNFRNMPQGTYLGQGIIGQPTAYVDGQPFRNLLRYVSP